MYTCKDPFAEVIGETRFARSLTGGSLEPIRPRVSEGAVIDMPDHLWHLLERCWEREPTQRPTAAQLLQSLSVTN